MTKAATAPSSMHIADMGCMCNAVAAVHDGYVLRKSIIRSPLGGRLLTQCMQHAIQSSGSQLHPQLLVRRYESAPGKFEVRSSPLAQISCFA